VTGPPAGRRQWDGDQYQQRIDRLASAGADLHGEAELVAGLQPQSVLDAGCGSGRVATELARRGIEVAGVDADPSMIATARRLAPELVWVVDDMAEVDLGRTFDVVVMAGNVPLFTPAGTRAALVAGCRRHLADGGALVAGFQLGQGYSVGQYDEHCQWAGLTCSARWSSWDSEPFTDQSTYQVSVHRAAGPA
jgi:SAM-dependent methyltransferase